MDSMRRRVGLAVIVVSVLAVILAAPTLPIALALVPIAVLEPGSLLLLGIAFLTLAGVARRVLSS